MSNAAAIQVGDQITYSTGRHTITLQYVRPGAYTVTTYQGTLRVEDNCGSYPTEQLARLVARGYAEMYRAEDAQPVTLAARVPVGEHRQVAPTMACAHLARTTDPQETALAVAVLTGRVDRGGNPGQATRSVLTALARRGLLTLTAKPGSRKADWAYGEPTDAGRRAYARLAAVAA